VVAVQEYVPFGNSSTYGGSVRSLTTGACPVTLSVQVVPPPTFQRPDSENVTEKLVSVQKIEIGLGNPFTFTEPWKELVV
jgi:hypothetical protein